MGKYLKSTECIAFEVSGRIARITLNRPNKRNAMSGQLLGELHDAMIEADALADVNVIVLAGAGKDFCSGYDLGDIYASHAQDAGTRVEAMNQTRKRECPFTCRAPRCGTSLQIEHIEGCRAVARTRIPF